jgi:hypothetical protein
MNRLMMMIKLRDWERTIKSKKAVTRVSDSVTNVFYGLVRVNKITVSHHIITTLFEDVVIGGQITTNTLNEDRLHFGAVAMKLTKMNEN